MLGREVIFSAIDGSPVELSISENQSTSSKAGESGKGRNSERLSQEEPKVEFDIIRA